VYGIVSSLAAFNRLIREMVGRHATNVEDYGAGNRSASVTLLGVIPEWSAWPRRGKGAAWN
jgi:hypothetical protein